MPALAKYSSSDFNKSWHGWGVNSNLWSIGQSGNYHMFTKEKDGAKIPKGEYILRFSAEWMPKAKLNPVV